MKKIGDLGFQERDAERKANEVGRVAGGGEVLKERRVGVRIHHAARKEDDTGGAAGLARLEVDGRIIRCYFDGGTGG